MDKVDNEQVKISVEEALRQSEERLRTFVAASNNMVYRMNADWTKMENLVGKKLLADTDTPINDWVEKYLLPEDQPHILSVIQHAIDTRSVFDLEHRVLQADSSVGWVHSRAVPIMNGQNEIVEWIGAGTDITNKRKAEETLQQSEEKYRSLFNSIDEGFCIFELIYDKDEQAVDWIYTEANPAFERQTGYVDPIGKKISYFQPDLERSWFNRFAKVARSGQAVRFVQYTEAMKIWYDVYAMPVGPEGSNRVSLLFTDISERKRAEEALKNSEQQMKALVKVREEFISIASHELKTPVTSIKAYAEIVQESFEEVSDPDNAELMRKMNDQIDRLVKLITELLDTTKISEGQLQLNLQELELGELIRERVEDLQRISAGHTLIMDLCSVPRVRADKERIIQVLTNLISNAIKYSPRGGEVHIGCTDKGQEIQVSVQDQGIGISQEMQEKVFERFFRAGDAQVQTLSGMGLGLYITAGIIQRHGGRIWVESEPGKGSTFYFTLPF